MTRVERFREVISELGCRTFARHGLSVDALADVTLTPCLTSLCIVILVINNFFSSSGW
jgi:hypothetical protein